MKMATNPTAQVTAFSRDVLGRFICNGLDEALGSADTQRPRSDGSPQNDARPFDLIVVGGGTFGAVIAAHMFHTDKLHRHRILVLEGGAYRSLGVFAGQALLPSRVLPGFPIPVEQFFAA